MVSAFTSYYSKTYSTVHSKVFSAVQQQSLQYSFQQKKYQRQEEKCLLRIKLDQPVTLMFYVLCVKYGEQYSKKCSVQYSVQCRVQYSTVYCEVKFREGTKLGMFLSKQGTGIYINYTNLLKAAQWGALKLLKAAQWGPYKTQKATQYGPIK